SSGGKKSSAGATAKMHRAAACRGWFVAREIFAPEKKHRPGRGGDNKRGARAVQTPAGENASRMDGSGGDLVAAWESIRANLRRDCGARTFDGWLRPIALGGFDSDIGVLRLELPSQFMADWVQTH